MAYYRNWRKRNAEVLCLAADDSDSSDADGLLRAQFSEDETASLSPSADGNISYYDSDALVLSSDSEVAVPYSTPTVPYPTAAVPLSASQHSTPALPLFSSLVPQSM